MDSYALIVGSGTLEDEHGYKSGLIQKSSCKQGEFQSLENEQNFRRQNSGDTALRQKSHSETKEVRDNVMEKKLMESGGERTEIIKSHITKDSGC